MDIPCHRMSRQHPPLFTIVIPLYNKECYIARTIGSVLAQLLDDFELLIVDDGSTDASAAEVERFADDRIRLLRRPNGGDGAARNTGIRHASGEIVTFLDGDDEWLPSFLAEIAALATQFSDSAMYATGIRLQYANGFASDVFVEAADRKRERFRIENYCELALQGSFVTSSSVAIRRSVFAEIGYFHEEVGASCDRDMWARVALRYPVAYSKKICAVYHCAHSQGRVSHAKRTMPPVPALARTVDALASQNGAAAVDPHLLELLHLQWLNRADRAIRAGNLLACREILTRRLAGTRRFRGERLWLQFITGAFPLPIVQLIRKIQHSRWWPLRSSGGNGYPRVVRRRTQRAAAG